MTLDQVAKIWIGVLAGNYVADSTKLKYSHITRLLSDHFGGKPLEKITTADLQGFRATRKIKASTAHGEIQILKTFFGFCEDQGLITANPARKLKMPRLRQVEKTPYTQEEIICILAASDRVSDSTYARLRSKAALLLMRHHGLRISDTIGLRRDAISQVGGQWRLRLRTKKTGAAIDHLVPDVVLEALGLLPPPYGTGTYEYYFCNGAGSPGSTLTNMQSILRKVYRLSGVKGAYSHRFRCTRASEILLAGGSLHDCALALGISDRVVERHYSRFMPEQRDRLDRLMEKATNREYQEATI